MDLRALFDQLPEMIAVIGPDLRVVTVNQRLCSIMGYEHDAVVGTNIFDYVHPDDAAYMASAWELRSATPGETGILTEARGRNADGTWRVVEIIGLSLLDDPRVGAMVMTMRDLVRKVGAGDQHARLQAMVDRTTDAVLLLDGRGVIEWANRRLTSRYGLDPADVRGQRFAELAFPEARDDAERWLAELLDAGIAADARIRLPIVDAGSRTSMVEWHGTNQLGDPLIEGVIVSGRDVTELVAMERRLEAQTALVWHVALHDPLTDLANRRAFTDAVAEHLEARRAAGDDGEVVVLFCDLDGFKAVNDQHGHAVGDEVLRIVAARLQRCLREGDLIARWGGDEFTILLAGGFDASAVAALVARLEGQLADPLREDLAGCELGISIGVSRAPVATADVDALLRHADEAMYARKVRRGST